MKVLVNLGVGWAKELEDWNERWDKKKVFDILPYGYKWAENEDVIVDYLQVTSKEKKLLLNNSFLIKLYFYFIKTPLYSLKYDAIWTHNDNEGLFFGALKCIPILKKYLPIHIANIIWITDKDFTTIKSNLISRILKNIDYITVLSKMQINEMHNKFNINNKKIKFVYYGLNKDIYSDVENIQQPKQIKFNNYILMVGSDIHRDIEMFKKITKIKKDDKFVLATNNKIYINDEYEKNVTVVQANLNEIKWLYKNSKYVILPLKNNTHASGCTTLIEVALQKKAVITTNVGGLDDYFKSGETAEVVDVGDLDGFIKKMNKLEVEEYRKKIETAAFNFIFNNEEFSSKTYANEFLKLSKQ